MYIYVCVHIQRERLTSGCLPLSVSTFCLRKPHSEPVIHQFDQTGQQVLGVFFSALPELTLNVSSAVPCFYVGVGGSARCHASCIALSPQPYPLEDVPFPRTDPLILQPVCSLPFLEHLLPFHCDRLADPSGTLGN